MDKTIAFHLGRVLFIGGLILAAVGLLLMIGQRWPIPGLGRLPGDIHYRGKNTQFYFPVVTCLVLSVIVSLILWAISFFAKK